MDYLVPSRKTAAACNVASLKFPVVVCCLICVCARTVKRIRQTGVLSAVQNHNWQTTKTWAVGNCTWHCAQNKLRFLNVYETRTVHTRRHEVSALTLHDVTQLSRVPICKRQIPNNTTFKQYPLIKTAIITKPKKVTSIKPDMVVP